MKKRLVSLLTALAMIVSMFSSAAALFPQTALADEGQSKIVVDNDGTSSATNAKFDEYFEGTAEEGVAALLNAGKCYVNGIQVPAEEPTQENYEYQVDWVKSLYKTETGWGYNVHKTTSANNLSFTDARKGFFDTITQVRGHQMTFYLGEDGFCEALNVESFEVVRIANIEEWGGVNLGAETSYSFTLNATDLADVQANGMAIGGKLGTIVKVAYK